MSERVVEPLVCAECGRIADDRAGGWRAAHLVWTDEGPPEDELVVICPECVEREQLR